MFDKNKIHLIPQILQDRARSMLTESSALVDIASRENCATQIEAVKTYCEQALLTYEKQKAVRNVGRKIKKSA